MSVEGIIHDVFEGLIALAALVSCLISWRNGGKVDAVDKKAAAIESKVEEVHAATNGLTAGAIATAALVVSEAAKAAAKAVVETAAAKQGARKEP